MWFVVALAARDLRDYEAMRAWIGTGWTPVLLMLLVVALTQHSWLGVQVVVEDYVQGRTARTLALLVSTFAHGVVAAAALFAVLKVAA
jgi:succinate dehydrogenase / fumarate reductase membrane anchor subunit